jgi:putative ABC transport system ATP-binding protein
MPAQRTPSPVAPDLAVPPERSGIGTLDRASSPASSGSRPTGDLAARVQAARRTYGVGATTVVALDDVTVGFAAGQFTAIMGPSGSGKSTLMHCMAGLDTLTSGQAFIGDTDLATLSDRELTLLRRDRLGFVFQAFNLLPTLTAEENITLPADLAGRSVDRAWFDTVVATLGLQERLTHRPAQLSGGQQQRTAVARALVSRPEVVFADEPTGALDSKASAELLRFLRSVVDGLGQTVVMVTHDPVAAAYADRVVFLVDGSVVEELTGPTRDSVLETMKRLGG